MKLLWEVDIDLTMAERIFQLKNTKMSDYDFRNRFEEILFIRDTLKRKCKEADLTPSSLNEFLYKEEKNK